MDEAGSWTYSWAEIMIADDEGWVVREVYEATDVSRYEAGSITKFACTLAILRLADAGRLSLDEPVGELVPSLAAIPAGQVALRHVLANRSGIPDGLQAALREDATAVAMLADPAMAAQKFGAGQLASEPGSEWSYDLINWIIAQAVIEKVSKQKLDRALTQLVFTPADMRDYRVFSGRGGIDFVKPAKPSRPLPGFLQCAGGLATAPADLLALLAFPHEGGLSDQALEELMTVTTPEEGYTLGGRFRETEAGMFLSWQSGSNGSYKSIAVYDPVSGLGFAAMTADGEDASIQAARKDWVESFIEE